MRLAIVCLSVALLFGGIAPSFAADRDPATLSHRSPPKGYAPVAITEIVAAVFAQNPNIEKFDIFARGKANFTLTKDRRVFYSASSSTSGLVTESVLVESNPNLLCMAPSGGWSGMCMRIWQHRKKGYFCTGVFGNNFKWRKKCRIILP